MRSRNIPWLLLTLMVLPVFVPSTEAADPLRGAKLYESRCGACHSIEQNRIGPRHLAVFGRAAGTQEGYDYSKALSASDILWNEASLDRWLANPQAFAPGQKMGYRLRKAEDRADIIEFFKLLAGQADKSKLKPGHNRPPDSGGE